VLIAVLLYCYNEIEILTMDDEKLIECVRKYPAVYDVSHPKCLDNNYKSLLWKNISQEMKEGT